VHITPVAMFVVSAAQECAAGASSNRHDWDPNWLHRSECGMRCLGLRRIFRSVVAARSLHPSISRPLVYWLLDEDEGFGDEPKVLISAI